MSSMITEGAALDALAMQLQHHAVLGVDTEFMRERTYFAQLCLLQLGYRDGAVCVDTLALADLSPLRQLMGSARLCKVLHAARQDQEVLWPAVGMLCNVFDTQVAAALTGLPAQVGYGELVRQILGVDLHKAETRTDWSRRPLSAAQLAYALDDVHYLLPLRERLTERLEALGRWSWFEEEMSHVGGQRFDVDPAEAWRRFKGFAELDPHRQELARTLSAWREQRAIHSDRPRSWILPDSALRDIVVHAPRSVAALDRVQDMTPGMRTHSGPQIVALIDAAQLPASLPPLPPRRRPDQAVSDSVRRLAQVTQEVAQQLGVAAEVLATRRELERLQAGERDGSPLSGWRGGVLGEKLLAAL